METVAWRGNRQSFLDQLPEHIRSRDILRNKNHQYILEIYGA